MSARVQFARRAVAAFVLAAGLICAVAARAQDVPSAAIGRVDGRDISIEGGVAGSGASGTAAPIIYVLNGSVVTVHSGKAKMTLFAGGAVEVCGPAKFTVLLSGSAVTLALNFGRVHAELPAKTVLRIFTPTIVGTPIDISGGSRDVTVGVNLDDSLCVVATRGAIQLEHQFSGEKLIVPEAGEFYLNSGKLVPIAGTPGSCQCPTDAPVAPTAAPTVPEFAATPPTPAAPDLQPAERDPGLQYSVLQNANRAHPVVAAARTEPPAAPVAPAASDPVAIQALVFSASAPIPPGPSQEILGLVREARVSPEWEFSGRVEPSDFAAAMKNALGEQAAASHKQDTPPQEQAERTKKKKNGGFWAALRRAFGRA